MSIPKRASLQWHNTQANGFGMYSFLYIQIESRRKPFCHEMYFQPNSSLIICLLSQMYYLAFDCEADYIFINHKKSWLMIFLIRHISRWMYQWTMWVIWKERYNQMFKGLECPLIDLKLIFLCTLYDWMTALFPFCLFLRRNWMAASSGHSFSNFLDFLD